MRSTFFRRWSVAARAFLIKATRLSTLRAIGVGSLFYRRLHRKIISEDTSMFSVAGWPLWGLIILFAVGLVLIIKGGDFFVDAASWIAEVSGIPHFIVGATIVSIATTLPELIVSCLGAARGTNALAIGNAVGSVTANTGLIMAISIICIPAVVKRSQYALKSILLLVATAILYLASFGNGFSIWGSILLLIIFVAAMAESIFSGKKEATLGEKTPFKKRPYPSTSASSFSGRRESFSERSFWSIPRRSWRSSAAFLRRSFPQLSFPSALLCPNLSRPSPPSSKSNPLFPSAILSGRISSISPSFCPYAPLFPRTGSLPALRIYTSIFPSVWESFSSPSSPCSSARNFLGYRALFYCCFISRI